MSRRTNLFVLSDLQFKTIGLLFVSGPLGTCCSVFCTVASSLVFYSTLSQLMAKHTGNHFVICFVWESGPSCDSTCDTHQNSLCAWLQFPCRSINDLATLIQPCSVMTALSLVNTLEADCGTSFSSSATKSSPVKIWEGFFPNVGWIMLLIYVIDQCLCWNRTALML